jgi:hypothetical protein
MDRLRSFLRQHARATATVCAFIIGLNYIVDIADGRLSIAAACMVVALPIVSISGTYLYLRKTRGIQY